MSRGMGRKKREKVRYPQAGDLWQYWLSPDVQFFVVVMRLHEPTSCLATVYSENTWECHVTPLRAHGPATLSPLTWPDTRLKLLQRDGG